MQNIRLIYGPVQNIMSIYGPVQNIMSIYGPVQNIMSIYGPVQSIMSIYGPVQNIMSIYGPVQNVMISLGSDRNPSPQVRQASQAVIGKGRSCQDSVVKTHTKAVISLANARLPSHATPSWWPHTPAPELVATRPDPPVGVHTPRPPHTP